MDLTQYGPFASAIAAVAALAASLSFLLAKSVGRLADWAWLGGDAPPVLLRTAVKAPAFPLIVFTLIRITRDNYLFFLVLAFLSGALAACLCIRLQHHSIVHVLSVPKAASDGSRKRDTAGNLLCRSVVIGTEANMRPEAANVYAAAKENDASLTLCRFMSGFGTPYDPEAIWPRQTLAKVRNRLCILAMAIILATVMSLYFAASVAQVHLAASPPQSATIWRNGSDAAAHPTPLPVGRYLARPAAAPLSTG